MLRSGPATGQSSSQPSSQRAPIAWFGLAVLAAAMVGIGCGETITSGTTPEIDINPGEFTFPRVNIDDSVTQEVEVVSIGDGALIIEGINVNLNGEFVFSFIGPDGAEQSSLTERIALQTDERLRLKLVYTPTDEDRDVGDIVLQTNLANSAVTIPVVTSDAIPEIGVNPLSLDFERVDAGQEKILEASISNRGQLPLLISDIRSAGSPDFTPLLLDRDIRQFTELLEDPDQDGEPGLSPGASVILKVKYAPVTEGPDAGEIQIVSNDPIQPLVSIDLRANGAIPCLEAVPSAVEFRTSLVNRTDSRSFTLESCGTQPLEIISVNLDAGADEAFELDTAVFDETFAGGLPEILPPVADDGSRTSRTLQVNFSPLEERVHNGVILVETNDPFDPIKEISLLGRGVSNACPQAIPAQNELFVSPLDVVLLDGSPSIDQDSPSGQPAFYEWVVVSRPEGSVSQPSDRLSPADPSMGPAQNPTTPFAQLWIDVAGTYVVELRVTDNLGLSSDQCQTSGRMTIVAEPQEDILVQLTWRTPEDPDETDGRGTDLDLHLVHPFADGWFAAPFDCYYENSKPDWGVNDDPSDNPVLDVDDANGSGPENINLNNPENTTLLGAPYLVGVHYYRSNDLLGDFEYGASFARLRIFIQGELAWDFDGNEKEMQAADHFWDAARIQWGPEGGTVETADRYYDQRP
ncbi:MAG: hypothetical protein ACE366_15835 [Bradymonadia bacterium]